MTISQIKAAVFDLDLWPWEL